MKKVLLGTGNDISALILRVTLGAVFFPHGAQKALGLFGGHGFSGSMDFFTGKMGMAPVVAFLVIATEFLGSLGLITGFLTRISALGILSVMTGAVVMVHGKMGFFMNWFGNKQGEGFEYHLLAIAIAIVLIIRGGGALSVDRALTAGKD